MSSIMVGIFDTQAHAAQARSKLLSAGFTDDEVTVTGENTSSSSASEGREDEGAISRFFRSLFGSDDEASSNAEGATYKEAFRRGPIASVL